VPQRFIYLRELVLISEMTPMSFWRGHDQKRLLLGCQRAGS
jgi:hypothetical protein